MTKTVHKDVTTYNPDSNYYMISYMHRNKDGTPAFIRIPFIHESKINEFVMNLILSSSDSLWGSFSDLQIISEKILDIDSKYEDKNTGEFSHHLTLRTVLYRDLYQDIADDIRNNPGQLGNYSSSIL